MQVDSCEAFQQETAVGFKKLNKKKRRREKGPMCKWKEPNGIGAQAKSLGSRTDEKGVLLTTGTPDVSCLNLFEKQEDSNNIHKKGGK